MNRTSNSDESFQSSLSAATRSKYQRATASIGSKLANRRRSSVSYLLIVSPPLVCQLLGWSSDSRGRLQFRLVARRDQAQPTMRRMRARKNLAQRAPANPVVLHSRRGTG